MVQFYFKGIPQKEKCLGRGLNVSILNYRRSIDHPSAETVLPLVDPFLHNLITSIVNPQVTVLKDINMEKEIISIMSMVDFKCNYFLFSCALSALLRIDASLKVTGTKLPSVFNSIISISFVI